MLQYGNCCKEKSIVIKVYITKNGKKSRVEYCFNKGCGYRRELPFFNK